MEISISLISENDNTRKNYREESSIIFLKNRNPALPSLPGLEKNQKKRKFRQIGSKPEKPKKNRTENGRIENGTTENQRLDYLIYQYREDQWKYLLTKEGMEILKKLNIHSLKKTGGRKKNDFIAIRKFPDEVEHTIEMKGYTGNKSHDHNAPWRNITPQYVNLGMFSNVDEQFAKKWHANLEEVKKELKIVYDIPTYEEWKKSDGNYQGSCRSKWGQNLKKKYKENKENESYIKKKSNEILIETFKNLTDKDIDEFKEKLLVESNKALSQKNWWLACKYENTTDLKPSKITLMEGTTLSSIDIIKDNKGKVPVFKIKYRTEKNREIDVCGEARLRWRNTTGIANIGWSIN